MIFQEMLRRLLSTIIILLLIVTNQGSPFTSIAYANDTVTRMEDKVLICLSSSANAYYSHVCSGLMKCTHEIAEVYVSEAKSKGYRACKICY